jgi:hypothetical protein
LLGALFGFNIGRLLFGSSPRSEQHKQNSSKQKTKQSQKSKSAKKLINKDEGEYIDFEEVK